VGVWVGVGGPRLLHLAARSPSLVLRVPAVPRCGLCCDWCCWGGGRRLLIAGCTSPPRQQLWQRSSQQQLLGRWSGSAWLVRGRETEGGGRRTDAPKPVPARVAPTAGRWRAQLVHGWDWRGWSGSAAHPQTTENGQRPLLLASWLGVGGAARTSFGSRVSGIRHTHVNKHQAIASAVVRCRSRCPGWAMPGLAGEGPGGS
jgi:hypothetical protein